MQLKVAASVKVTARRGSTPTATCGHSIDDMPPVTRQSRRPNGAESRNLNVRVPPDVLEAAKAAAAEREETLSAAVVRFLREYAALDTEEER
ncbi:MAG: hypothetical protein HOV78_11335 [Hamadaea sp.]|nr:hypothetical protein [Hamadaea sp.]